MTTKVIIKRNEDKFQWSQTDEAITLTFPLRNVLLKNIDVLQTSTFIKVNSPSIKYIAVVDFMHPIDYENPKNRIQLHDTGLEVLLMKGAEYRHHWEFIMPYTLSKEELKKRREESLAEYYRREDEKFKEAEKRKIQMDKMSIDSQMKVEEYQRKQLKQRKEDEKRQTEEELFKDLENLE